MTAYVVFAAMRAGELDAAKAVAVTEKGARAGGARMFLAPGKPVTVAELRAGHDRAVANDAAICSRRGPRGAARKRSSPA
jgi:D-alanyl-D-alanine carboxypeptidase (penicillin-binding protein 5/6)